MMRDERVYLNADQFSPDRFSRSSDLQTILRKVLKKITTPSMLYLVSVVGEFASS